MSSLNHKSIKQLSVQLANQIAAGEVVERPASVLKELIENALDANSSDIEIDIIEGGKSLIRIKDNGSGIVKDELQLAVSRHATSKLETIDDLEHIESLGFRGEALASISSISRLSIHSKFKSADKAWELDTGSDSDFANYKAQVIPSALALGTLIEVRDLFYNTPARRKFLRTDKTEFRFIDDIFKRMALSHFSVAFKLTHNKKLVKKLSISDDKISRLKKIFGEEFNQQFMLVNEAIHSFNDLGCLKLSGWISNKSNSRHQGDQQYFYVNGRYVRDKLLNHALRQAYQENLATDQYASYILYLSIDPGYVDVNVHPTKHEVRFSQSRIVHDFIVSVLSRTLSPVLGGVDSNDLTAEQSRGLIEKGSIEDVNHRQNYTGYTYKTQSHRINTAEVKDQIKGLNALYHQPQQPNFQEKIASKQNLDQLSFDFAKTISSLAPDLQYLQEHSQEQHFKGQVLSQIGAILIAKEENNLWLIHRLKVAQQINFQLLNNQLDSANNVQLKPQKLLIPQCINLNSAQCDLLMRWQQALAKFAIEFSLSSDESIMLRSLPKVIFTIDNKLTLASLVNFLGVKKSEKKEYGLNGKKEYKDLLPGIFNILSENINSELDFDENKQQLIVNHIAKFRDSEKLKACYQVLDEAAIGSIIQPVWERPNRFIDV